MQHTQGHKPYPKLCPCATCIYLLLHAPTSTQDGLDPLQLALVVFSNHQLAQTHYLHSWWSSPATCTGDVFSIPTSPFTDVHKHIGAHCNLHCVVVYIYIYIHIYIYIYIERGETIAPAKGLAIYTYLYRTSLLKLS